MCLQGLLFISAVNGRINAHRVREIAKEKALKTTLDPARVGNMKIDRKVLRFYLNGSGISERELARKAQVSHSTINHYVTGRRTTCTPATAGKINKALGAQPGDIFQANLFFVASSKERIAA